MQIARQEPMILRRVEMILIELHLSHSLRANVAGVAAFFKLVFEQHGFRLMYLHANGGKPRDRMVAPALTALGATKNICCYEMALVNPRLVEGIS